MRTLCLLFLLVGALAAQPLAREAHLRDLKRQGFRVSPGLPTGGPRTLRPPQEIGRRMLALHALSLWVAGSPRWSDQQVRDYVAHLRLEGCLTADERAILKLSRDQARELHLDDIGWKLENLWALAWVTGFDLKPGIRGQFAGPELRRLVFEWLPGSSADSQTKFLKNLHTRPTLEVADLEDYFYCCHNAVRSAQLGGKTVPEDYDPVAEGGCVHERRHALTWCLSPGVSWNETDLNT